MSGYLVPISKSAKSKAAVAGVTGAAGAAASRTTKGRVTQAKVQAAVKDAVNRAKASAEVPPSAATAAHAPVPPGTPYNKISERGMRLAHPGVLVGGGAGVLAAGGGGAYLYRRKRAEKSLSSMQRD